MPDFFSQQFHSSSKKWNLSPCLSLSLCCIIYFGPAVDLTEEIILCWRRFKFIVFACFWRDSPQWARASPFLRFLDHTQRRTTVGRTPLHEWSARCRDLYLRTHNTHNRQTSMPSVGFEPRISAGRRPQTYALDRAATGTDMLYCRKLKYPMNRWLFVDNSIRLSTVGYPVSCLLRQLIAYLLVYLFI
jgi:hypothetical protein